MQVSVPRAPRGLSRGKRIAFAAAAISLPLIVVLLVEMALRIAGVGLARREPFQPVPGRSSHLAVDPEFGGMFFQQFRPNVGFDPILASKPAGSIRVIALGGSTTAGFPYHWYYGFPARLEDRLAEALPDRLIEVANLGMTATNSYTLLTLAEEVAEQRPDAVVIYAGHNEYYGAYGTSGTQGWTGRSRGVKRILIGASRTALVAGIGSLFEEDGAPAAERRTMMARIVREASIEAGSASFSRGVDHYAANLRAAVQVFERAGIHVFLATLTSNLADQPPLGDEPEALAAYERGRERLAAGDSSGARKAFLEAKELDGIRFRAPGAMNEVVRNVAEEFATVELVDVASSFRAASGIEGADLFTDHLHPNADGYGLIADAFFDAMATSMPALRDAMATTPSPSEVDTVEAGYARLQIATLTGGYPFRKDRTPAQSEAAVRAAADSMSRSGHYAAELAVHTTFGGMSMTRALDAGIRQAQQQADTLTALRMYRALLHWQPFNEGLMEKAVGYAIENPTFDPQTGAIARYASIHSRSAHSLNALAAIAVRSGEFDRAESLLAVVEEIDPQSQEMLYNRARLLVLQGDTLAARKYFERYQSVISR